MIVGGVNAQEAMLNTAEVFDPASQTFYLPPTDMQTARAFATLKLLPDGKVQIIGGDAELSMEVFDPRDGIFIAKALLPPNADLLGATLSTQSRAALFSPTISQDPLLQGILTAEQLSLLDRADQSITELPSRNQALVAGGVNSAGQVLNSAKLVSSSKASVTTDKTDYAPGQIVTITGSGFQPNEQVYIYFHEFPEEYPDIFLSAVANQQGNFVIAEFAPQEIDIGRIFTLTAIGQTSGFAAQTAFKDALSVTSVSPNSGPTTGGTSVTISVSGIGNGPWTVLFGGVSATSVAKVGGNLTAVTPAHVAGPVTVTVREGAGSPVTCTASPCFTYNAAAKAPPVITFGTAPTPTFGGGNFTVSASTTNTDSSTLTYSHVSGPCAVVNANTGIFSSSGAGTCVVRASGAETTNFLAASADQSVTIAKAPVTATAGGGTTTYDGTTKSPSACLVTGVYKGDLTCANNPASVGPGFGTTTIEPVVSGTALANFEVTNVNGSYTINKAPVTATAGGGTTTYDGTTKSPSACLVTGVYKGDLTCANNPASVGPGFGTTTIEPVVSGTGLANFEVTNVNGSYTINKAPVTATAGGGTTTYDGTTKSPSACLVTGVYKGDLTCANNPASVGPGFGTTTIEPVVSGTGLANFEVTNVNGSYTINKAPVTATAGGGTTTYDGTTKSPSACLVTGVYKGDLTCANNPASVGPGFGTTTIEPVVSGTALANFEVTNVNGSYTINKAPVTATAGGGTTTYDGTTKSPSACLVTGVYKGDLTCANNPASVGPGFGTTTIEPVVSGTGLANFEVTNVNGSYTINKAPVTATAGGGTTTYDGTTKSPSACLVTGVYKGDLTCANNPASVGPGFGTTTIEPVVSGTGLANFEVTNVNGSYTINKAPVTATAGGGTTTYDGTTKSPSACLVTGVYKGDLTCANNPASVGPGFGTTTIEPVVSGTGLANFEVTNVNGSYTINPLGFDGFLSPIGGADDATGGDFAHPIRTVKLGSTLPVKFIAYGGGGTPWLTGVHTIQAFKYSSDTYSLGDPMVVSATDSATTGNQFRLTDGQWHFNMSTKSGFSQGIWKIVATLEDGSTHYAWIALKK